MSITTLDPVDECLSGQSADLAQGLADRRQAGEVVSRFANVVEADNRNVFGHAHAGFFDGTNRPNRRNVVIGEQRGKRNLPR